MEKVRPSRQCRAGENSIFCNTANIKAFNLPLTENQIIELHEIFMTPAERTIQTRNLASGRMLVETMLDSLAYYNRVGCLTTSKRFAGDNVLDVYSIIIQNSKTHGIWYAIEEFFVNYHSIDFIWVELTQELINQIGPDNITYLCKILTQNQNMPIVVLQYDK